MNLTVTTIAKSLADYLAPCFPSVAFYEDPNQQGSRTPCMFLQTRYNYLTLETGGFWRRRMGLDLTYLEDYNRPDLQQRYQRAGENLDLLMRPSHTPTGRRREPSCCGPMNGNGA